MNLLQMAPLCDSRGNIRYFIGAQVDVSGLAMEGAQMESLQNIQAQKENPDLEDLAPKESKSEFQELGELFSPRELQNVREHGGNLFQPIVNEDPNHRLFLQDSDTESEHHAPSSHRQTTVPEPSPGLSLTGVYKNVSPFRSTDIVKLTVPVSSRSPLSIPSHSVHVSYPSNPWHAPILFPESHRRVGRKARQHSQRYDGRSQCHCAYQMGYEVQ